MIEFSPAARMHTRHGTFSISAFRTGTDEHAVLWKGSPGDDSAPLVRVQSACVTSTAFMGDICDCAAQIEMSMAMIERTETGVLIYLSQEGRGLGLYEKVCGIRRMNLGESTVTAYTSVGLAPDKRDYSHAGAVLVKLGVSGAIRLRTNNPLKLSSLTKQGFAVSHTPLEVTPTDLNRQYLATKKYSFGHLLDLV
jgi:3,4-dihydroxy 2-butanone 4-phosphate synthase / GTP cyclohydrolase II